MDSFDLLFGSCFSLPSVSTEIQTSSTVQGASAATVESTTDSDDTRQNAQTDVASVSNSNVFNAIKENLLSITGTAIDAFASPPPYTTLTRGNRIVNIETWDDSQSEPRNATDIGAIHIRTPMDISGKIGGTFVPHLDLDGFLVITYSLQCLTCGISVCPKSPPHPFKEKSYFRFDIPSFSEAISFQNSNCIYIGSTGALVGADVYAVITTRSPSLKPEKPRLAGKGPTISKILANACHLADDRLRTEMVLPDVPIGWKQDVGMPFLHVFSRKIRDGFLEEGLADECVFMIRKFGQKKLVRIQQPLCDVKDVPVSCHDESVIAYFVDIGLSWQGPSGTVSVWKRDFVERVRQQLTLKASTRPDVYIHSLCYNLADLNAKALPETSKAGIVCHKLYSEEAHCRRLMGQMPLVNASPFSIVVSQSKGLSALFQATAQRFF
jgi:hypothetical protein